MCLFFSRKDLENCSVILCHTSTVSGGGGGGALTPTFIKMPPCSQHLGNIIGQSLSFNHFTNNEQIPSWCAIFFTEVQC